MTIGIFFEMKDGDFEELCEMIEGFGFGDMFLELFVGGPDLFFWGEEKVSTGKHSGRCM